MKIKKFAFPGVVEIIPKKYKDERGYFKETYKLNAFKDFSIYEMFYQDNESKSKTGVFRGLHLQKYPYAQAKLVRVAMGRVLDIIVDLRANSPTFRQVFSCVLDSKKGNMLYVPVGFAHGFLAVKKSIFVYKCSSGYCKEFETGIRWNDPKLDLPKLIRKHGFKPKQLLISEKDRELPLLEETIAEIENMFEISSGGA